MEIVVVAGLLLFTLVAFIPKYEKSRNVTERTDFMLDITNSLFGTNVERYSIDDMKSILNALDAGYDASIVDKHIVYQRTRYGKKIVYIVNTTGIIESSSAPLVFDAKSFCPKEGDILKWEDHFISRYHTIKENGNNSDVSDIVLDILK